MAYIERVVQTITNTTAGLAGSTQTVNLPRGHLYSRIWLRLTIGNSTTANFVAGAQNTWITNLTILMNGQAQVKNYSWYDLFCQNAYLHHATLDQTALTASTTGGFSSNVIEFATSPDSAASLFPSHKASTFDLQIAFGTAAALGGDTTVAITLEVLTREVVFEGQDIRNLVLNKESTSTLVPTATGETQGSTLRCTLGNAYRRFFIITSGGASTGYQNNSVTDITLKQDGVVVHRKLNFLLCRSQDAAEYGLPVAERITGVAFLDLDMTEDYSQTLDSAAFSMFELIFSVPSVANAVTIRVIPQELILPQTEGK